MYVYPKVGLLKSLPGACLLLRLFTIATLSRSPTPLCSSAVRAFSFSRGCLRSELPLSSLRLRVPNRAAVLLWSYRGSLCVLLRCAVPRAEECDLDCSLLYNPVGKGQEYWSTDRSALSSLAHHAGRFLCILIASPRCSRCAMRVSNHSISPCA